MFFTSPAICTGPGTAVGCPASGPGAGGPAPLPLPPPPLPPPPPPPLTGGPGGLHHKAFLRLLHISSGEGWLDAELPEVLAGVEVP